MSVDMQTPGPGPTLVEPSFDAAAEMVLAYLHREVPLALWAVTRVVDGVQHYLYLPENGYGLEEGITLPWEDSLCFHMASGRAPAIAPDTRRVRPYADAARKLGFEINAYVGTTIMEEDGALFGAICGVDPAVRTGDPAITAIGPQLQLLGRLLSLALAADRRRDQYAGALVRAEMEAQTDALTGVLNRTAWQRIVDQVQTSLHRYTDPLVAVVLDLDHLKLVNDTEGHAAGDRYIRAAAAALSSAVRDGDVVARIGGDEFAALLVGCPESQLDSAGRRINRGLERAGVQASVGMVPVTATLGVHAAVAEADARMYTAKAARRRESADLPTEPE